MAAVVELKEGVSAWYENKKVVEGPGEVELRDFDPTRDVYGEELPQFPDVSSIELRRDESAEVASVSTRVHDTRISPGPAYEGRHWQGSLLLDETYGIYPQSTTVFQRGQPIAEVTHKSADN